jgi:hypothetical protein
LVFLDDPAKNIIREENGMAYKVETGISNRRMGVGARPGPAKAGPRQFHMGAFPGARPCRMSPINNLRLPMAGGGCALDSEGIP